MAQMEYLFIVGKGEERLDRFLQKEFEALGLDFPVTRSYLKVLIEKGAVTYGDGRVVKKCGEVPKQGTEITVFFDEPEQLSAEPEDIAIDIVFQNENFAVINKPQGLVVHPCDTARSHTLVNALLFHLKDLSNINGIIRPGIVHRLDKDTSGLLVVAKNNMAHLSLQKQISEKTAERKYLAILDRNIKEDNGRIDVSIGRDQNNRLRMAACRGANGGRVAVTTFTVLERFMDFTFVEFVLETGRTHQIRAHAKHINHPVTGDILYGGTDKFKTRGQLLHAYSLAFDEPTTGERLTFTAEPPESFQNVLQSLKKGVTK